MVGDQHITAALDAARTGERLDSALAAVLPDLSRARIQALIRDGALADAQGRVLTDPSARVPGAMMLHLSIPPARPIANAPQAIALVVAYEDAELIVIDKPAGMVVHPAAGNADGTLVNALLHHCAGQLSGIGGMARPGIVHRIDKDTSGLIVAAKTDRAHAGLAAQFAAHSIHREYRAIVAGHPLPPAGTVFGAIGRSATHRKKMAVVADGRGKQAVTHFRTVRCLHGAALVACQLETGRTHQVRVHMTHIGHPLLGDPVYGRPAKGLAAILRATGFARQALHAAELGFDHPVTGARVACTSPLPADMQQLLVELDV